MIRERGVYTRMKKGTLSSLPRSQPLFLNTFAPTASFLQK
jgi:hypothetical protein